MTLLAQNCGTVDLCRVWEILFKAAAPVLFLALVGLLGYLGRWALYRKQQDRLHALALCRREGVKLRNIGKKRNLTGPAFKTWETIVKKWKKELFETATKFSKVEAERLDTLDWMEARKFPGIRNKEQLQLLRDVNETLKRLQQLLEERVRPSFTP